MKTSVRLIGLFVALVGVTGVVAPDALAAVGHAVITPVGLYVLALVRCTIGLVLFLAAPSARAPKTLRVAGAAVFLGGVATPFFGVQRSLAVLDWELAQGTIWIRLGALLGVAIGTFFMFVVTPLRPRSA